MSEWDEEQSTTDTLLALKLIFQRLLRGDNLQAFCDWFVLEGPALIPQLPDDPQLFHALARAFWSTVPLPSNRWRPRSLPKTNRNASCHCGSGRKHKHCCANLGDVELPFEPEMLAALAIQHAPPEAFSPDSIRQIPPFALAQAALFWEEQGQHEQTVRVLSALFEHPEHLDERHEYAFDILMDALQQLGQNKHRYQLAERIASHRNKDLSTAARARMISILSDQGEFEHGWELLRQAQRDDPDNPALFHLELIVLLGEGRTEEARLRAPLLARRARKLGYEDLASVLEALGSGDLQAVQPGGRLDEDFEPDVLAVQWLELCNQAPATLPADEARALYFIETAPAARTGSPSANAVANDRVEYMRWLRVRSRRDLAALERRWQRRFPVTKPTSIELFGDADVLHDDITDVQAFLRDHPQAWLSVQVLDDLLLGLREILFDDSTPAQHQAAWQLAEHALRLLHALLAKAPDAESVRAQDLGLDWTYLANRPLLRLLAQVIDIGLMQERKVLALMQWSVALNPTDNQGWRMALTDSLISQGRPLDALALLDEYPSDLPPAGHRRALALYQLGRLEEARDALSNEYPSYPKFLEALWPEVMDVPAPDSEFGMRVGGECAAYEYRLQSRSDWVRSGALAWARGLKLPKPKVQAKPKSSPPRGQNRSAHDNLVAAPQDPEKLRQHLIRKFDWPRVHGFLTAIAWSPEVVMPERWMMTAIGFRNSLPPKTEAAFHKALQADMDAVVFVYNALALMLTDAASDAAMPLQLSHELSTSAKRRAPVSEAALLNWSAGFVQGAELSASAWRSAGRPLQTGPKKGQKKPSQTAFSTLYDLAARASLPPVADDAQADSWRPTHDDGLPLLVGIDPQESLDMRSRLDLALRDLWQVTLPLRQTRSKHSSPNSLRLSHWSIERSD